MSRKKSPQITFEQNKISKKIKSLILIAVLALSPLTFAQPGLEFEEDVDDEAPATPIDSNILILLAAGMALGITFIKKNESLTTYKK